MNNGNYSLLENLSPYWGYTKSNTVVSLILESINFERIIFFLQNSYIGYIVMDYHSANTQFCTVSDIDKY